MSIYRPIIYFTTVISADNTKKHQEVTVRAPLLSTPYAGNPICSSFISRLTKYELHMYYRYTVNNNARR